MQLAAICGLKTATPLTINSPHAQEAAPGKSDQSLIAEI